MAFKIYSQCNSTGKLQNYLVNCSNVLMDRYTSVQLLAFYNIRSFYILNKSTLKIHSLQLGPCLMFFLKCRSDTQMVKVQMRTIIILFNGCLTHQQKDACQRSIKGDSKSQYHRENKEKCRLILQLFLLLSVLKSE